MNTKEIVMSIFSVAIKVVVGIIVIMFIYKYAITAYDYGYKIFGEKPMTSGDGREVSVTISPEMSVKEIGQILENKALISDAKLFVIQEKLSEYKDGIKPGIYELNTSMTVDEMIAIMAADGNVLEADEEVNVTESETFGEEMTFETDWTEEE
ncbi:MAG: endolytic transglycosylase MltG [Lachnospiraceae bacterium]|nr:endolytic transglycosylase MltG [Candidatus Colinaster equi]